MKNYHIQKVGEQDSRRIWEIRNHPVARKYSGSPDVIPFANHQPWFTKKYFSGQDNHCYILKKQDDNLTIGYCRFDFDDDNNNYIISIAIDPDHHSQGLGHHLLSNALRQINLTKDISAEIQKDNLASVKLFTKNNFKVSKEDKELNKKFYGGK